MLHVLITMCRVVWVTNSSEQVPTVVYGTSPDALTLTALGNTSTYTAADMCGPYANQSVYVATLFDVSVCADRDSGRPTTSLLLARSTLR
jgi:hypothetical protein